MRLNQSAKTAILVARQNSPNPLSCRAKKKFKKKYATEATMLNRKFQSQNGYFHPHKGEGIFPSLCWKKMCFFRTFCLQKLRFLMELRLFVCAIIILTVQVFNETE